MHPKSDYFLLFFFNTIQLKTKIKNNAVHVTHDFVFVLRLQIPEMHILSISYSEIFGISGSLQFTKQYYWNIQILHMSFIIEISVKSYSLFTKPSYTIIKYIKRNRIYTLIKILIISVKFSLLC